MFFAKTARFSVIEVGLPILDETSKQPEQIVDANDVDALAAAVTKLQSAIKELKKSGISPEDKVLVAKNDELQSARARLEKAQSEKKPSSSFNRKGTRLHPANMTLSKSTPSPFDICTNLNILNISVRGHNHS